jgi:alpha-N-arabinofuranosidase
MLDFVQAKLRSPKKIMLSFDEYGTMVRPNSDLHPGRNPHNEIANHYVFDPNRKYVRHDPNNMDTGRGWHRSGDMVNALTGASTLLAFLRHADRVKIACMTGGLSALAATDRDHVWKTASYYPYIQLMKYGQGVSMQTSVDCDTFDIPGYAINDNSQYHTYNGVKFIDTAAAYDEKNGQLNLFVINRNWESDQSVELDVSGFKEYDFVEQLQLYHEDMDAIANYDNQDIITPSINSEAIFIDGVVTSNLKKLSWNVFRFKKKA